MPLLHLSLIFLPAVTMGCTEHPILIPVNVSYSRQERVGRVCGNTHGGPRRAMHTSFQDKNNLLDPWGKDLLVGLAPSSLSFYGWLFWIEPAVDDLKLSCLYHRRGGELWENLAQGGKHKVLSRPIAHRNGKRSQRKAAILIYIPAKIWPRGFKKKNNHSLPVACYFCSQWSSVVQQPSSVHPFTP